MNSYLEIKDFKKCSKQEWNTFCENSDDTWLWHQYDSIIAKSLWLNLENNSFLVIDNSNKKQIVSIFPFFLEKKKKLLIIHLLNQLEDQHLLIILVKKKKQKIIHFINNYLINEMKRRKIYKCEFLLSTLSSSIINKRRSIPNPLFPLIDSDNSSFTWIINLKEKSFDEISYNFSKKTKDILNKKKINLSLLS